MAEPIHPRGEPPTHVSLHAGASARLALVGVTAAIIVAWAVVLLSHTFERHPVIAAVIFAAGPAWLFVWWFGVYFVHRARIRRSVHLPCIGCGYELVASRHQASGNCPECGTRFERAQLEAYWSQFEAGSSPGEGPA